jgi:hypothetical protein
VVSAGKGMTEVVCYDIDFKSFKTKTCDKAIKSVIDGFIVIADWSSFDADGLNVL